MTRDLPPKAAWSGKPGSAISSELSAGSGAVPLPVDAISGVPLEPEEARYIRDLPAGLAQYILEQHPELLLDDCIDNQTVDDIRRQYVIDVLIKNDDDVTPLETEIAESIATQAPISEDVDTELSRMESFGDRISDKTTRFGGSWSFVVLFTSFVAAWIVVNVSLSGHAFDVFPFVLLNLILSLVAALQAAAILMTQRKQEARDQLRAANDYQVNLKAEIEVRNIHEKLDLILAQHARSIQEPATSHTKRIRGTKTSNVSSRAVPNGQLSGQQ